LEIFEAAMGALIRGDQWRTIHPSHAFDFVNTSMTAPMLTFGGAVRLTKPNKKAFIAQVLKCMDQMAKRSYIPAKNMWGNEIGPQVVTEALYVKEMIGYITAGAVAMFSKGESIAALPPARGLHKTVLKRSERRECASCQKEPGEGEKFKACGQCQLARYCSR
jgi:hypothetical protein